MILNNGWQVSESSSSPQELSFGWQRAQVLGAFFNGSILFALGISIFLQSIERFVTMHRALAKSGMGLLTHSRQMLKTPNSCLSLDRLGWDLI